MCLNNPNRVYAGVAGESVYVGEKFRGQGIGLELLERRSTVVGV